MIVFIIPENSWVFRPQGRLMPEEWWEEGSVAAPQGEARADAHTRLYGITSPL